MAVESRFVVVRNGVEVETFMDKKAADEYDKMLDMADNLSDLFDQSSLELSDKLVEDIIVFIAKNREDVLIALQAKKPKVAKPIETAAVTESMNQSSVDKTASKAKAASKPKSKSKG